jgi:3-dehydroquinate synthase
MRAAARVAERSGVCGREVVEEQEELLEAFGLPGPLPEVRIADVLAALPRDKKSLGGEVRWVLPRELGRAEPGHRAGADVVRAVLEEVLPA